MEISAAVPSANLPPVVTVFDAPSAAALGKPGSSQRGVAGAGAAFAEFGEFLQQKVTEVSNTSKQADAAIQTYAVGGDIALHDVMLALEKAGTMMDLAVQVRNKLVQAYQEVSRMHV
jgi:flagellar hook-basal body complex protein FliE